MNFHHLSNSIFNNISKAYLEDESFRNEFYTYNALDNSVWASRAKVVDNQEFDRIQLVEALNEINKRLGASVKTLDNIELLRDSQTKCVVTGQQTGVLGGPLFTLYKAATTIKKAKELSVQFNSKVVPIFWMASEDHDFEEAREIGFIDDGKLKTLKVDKKPGRGQNNPHKTPHNYSYLKEPVGFIDINTSVKSLLLEARHAFGDSEFEKWCCDVFENTVLETETLSDWFGRIYLKLFEDEGLIVLDPLNSKIRKLGTGFLKSAIEKSEEVIELVHKAGLSLKSHGYTPLITPREGATGLYLLERGERLPITRECSMYGVREDQEREAFTLSRLQGLMEKHPEDFSTNVILRPIIQDVYLPTIAYVAGPGEASYYAQLKHVYKLFDMEMPIILPRENFTVYSSDSVESMEQVNVSLDEILSTDQIQLERKLLKLKDKIDVDGLFDGFSSEFDEMYHSLVATLENIDGEINNISEKNLELIHQQFNYLKQKSHRFHRKNHKEELKEIKGLYQWLKPFGGLQERKLGLVNVLSQTGPVFIDYIVNKLEYDIKHRAVLITRGKV